MYYLIHFLLLLIIPFIFWYRWRIKRFLYFINLGISGPKPNFLTGNMDEIMKKGIAKCHFEWIKKYGNVVGYFLGSRPVLLVSDLDFMKDFMVVNHMNAAEREWFIEDGGVPLKGFRKSAIAVVGGAYWKELRNIMSPTFTSRKLKRMIPILDKSAEKFLKKVETNVKNKQLIPMKTFLSEFAFDSTMLNIFGVENDDSETYRKFHEDIKQIALVPFKDIIISLAFYFPEFSTVFTLIREVKDKIFYYLRKPSCFGAYKSSLNILRLRKANPQIQRDDFVELLMNAGKDSNIETEKTGTKKRDLTTDEIVINMLDFALGSYETSVSSLTYAMFMLSKYPEIQDKVRKELNSINSNEEELKDSFVYGIPYLDQVINETLRYYTIIRILVNRVTTEEIKWNSITLPKNLVLQVAAYQLHHDPKYWENPECFDPDRFSSENKHKINPIVCQAFGYGPRNCMGIRFAYLMLRLTLARLLSKFKFEICDETEELINGSEFLAVKPINELILRAVPV